MKIAVLPESGEERYGEAEIKKEAVALPPTYKVRVNKRLSWWVEWLIKGLHT
jgi:hypothetical protein